MAVLDPLAYRQSADYRYTEEPMPEIRPWDRSTPIDIWKMATRRAIRIENARRSPMLAAVNSDGVSLYRLTSGGVITRTFPLSSSRRRAVLARDGSCVVCGAGGPFDVDHIVRYADGGSNELDNLQTLCVPCHRKKGGR